MVQSQAHKTQLRHRNVYGQEHAITFTAAIQLDALTSIRDATPKALANDQAFAQFKEDLKPILVKQA